MLKILALPGPGCGCSYLLVISIQTRDSYRNSKSHWGDVLVAPDLVHIKISRAGIIAGSAIHIVERSAFEPGDLIRGYGYSLVSEDITHIIIYRKRCGLDQAQKNNEQHSKCYQHLNQRNPLPISICS